ncbi:hypothetical protein CSOJ01_12896 [Colletotrichum sojae]|uniref:Uncharacterized protein n=1 Tax=Colletotrichum sojae TaxID=2175907 RepID=A0A8H6MLS9_9PEZI|nr:hypothetical protein CSOJ01_12896 [Colletotrichum sojae]
MRFSTLLGIALHTASVLGAAIPEGVVQRDFYDCICPMDTGSANENCMKHCREQYYSRVSFVDAPKTLAPAAASADVEYAAPIPTPVAVFPNFYHCYRFLIYFKSVDFYHCHKSAYFDFDSDLYYPHEFPVINFDINFYRLIHFRSDFHFQYRLVHLRRLIHLNFDVNYFYRLVYLCYRLVDFNFVFNFYYRLIHLYRLVHFRYRLVHHRLVDLHHRHVYLSYQLIDFHHCYNPLIYEAPQRGGGQALDGLSEMRPLSRSMQWESLLYDLVGRRHATHAVESSRLNYPLRRVQLDLATRRSTDKGRRWTATTLPCHRKPKGPPGPAQDPFQSLPTSLLREVPFILLFLPADKVPPRSSHVASIPETRQTAQCRIRSFRAKGILPIMGFNIATAVMMQQEQPTTNEPFSWAGGGGGGGGGTGPGSPPADLIDERILLGQERAPFERNPHVEKMADKQGPGPLPGLQQEEQAAVETAGHDGVSSAPPRRRSTAKLSGQRLLSDDSHEPGNARALDVKETRDDLCTASPPPLPNKLKLSSN